MSSCNYADSIDVSTALWHAFNGLDEQRTGLVQKSKLKVFTASIGTLLGYNGAENGLKEHRSTPHLNFDDYLFYINKELLCFSPGSLDLKDMKKYRAQIEELSWLVCRKSLLKRDFIAFADHSVFQLFRIFCMLGELVRVDKLQWEVVMVADEVEHVTKLFMDAIGQSSWDSADFSQIAQVLPTFKFTVFLALLETRYANSIEVSGLTEATREVHDMLVEDVIKKGYLSKKMMLVGKMRERWFVLQPSVLSFYSSRDESDKKGEILLNNKCIVESCIDATSKNHSFQLINGDKKFEFCASDYKTKHQWINAIKMSMKLFSNKESYQRTLAQKRKVERESILHKKIEEKSEQQSKKTNGQEISDSEMLIKEAEEKADTELKLRLKGEKEYLDLQDSYSQLEKLLEEQKQATRDEEIVRALQARMLTEEWAKREKLEQIEQEQQELIENETKNREKIEEEHKRHKLALSSCQERLKFLEKEKNNFEKQLKEMKDKVVMAERAKEILEAKLKVRERNLSQQMNATNKLNNNNNGANIVYLR